MSLFVSSFVNKIDRKGRVSVPAQFRQVLMAKGSEFVLLSRHPKLPAIQGNGMDWVEDMQIRIAQIPANIVAGFMHLEPHALFQVAEADREDVKVSFA